MQKKNTAGSCKPFGEKEKIVIDVMYLLMEIVSGASLGLYHFLDGLGKEANVVVPGFTPSIFCFKKGRKKS